MCKYPRLTPYSFHNKKSYGIFKFDSTMRMIMIFTSKKYISRLSYYLFAAAGLSSTNSTSAKQTNKKFRLAVENNKKFIKDGRV